MKGYFCQLLPAKLEQQKLCTAQLGKQTTPCCCKAWQGYQMVFAVTPPVPDKKHFL